MRSARKASDADLPDTSCRISGLKGFRRYLRHGAGRCVCPLPSDLRREDIVIQNEWTRIWVNRTVAFLVGGLLVLAIMGFAVVAPLKSDKEAIAEQLDELQNGASRLLAEAKVYVASKSYDDAMKSLNTLFQQQPGSNEVVEGRALYTEMEVAIQAREQNWEAAVGEIRAAWEKAKAAEILAKAEQDKQVIVTGLAETLVKEWEKAEGKIKADFEKL